MNAFATAYSEYYDVFYGNKDYAGEAAHIDALLNPEGHRDLELLEFGCGTGRHALELASLGHQVHGVDRSSGMIANARDRLTKVNPPPSRQVTFETSDITSYRGKKRYDAITALFHVMSYLTDTKDVSAAFESAAHHLNPGGRFAFDFWYGPAVLVQQPSVRVKRAETERHHLVRIAEPCLDCNANLVRVTYTVHSVEKAGGSFEEFREQHLMRYFFLPELEFLLNAAGFKLETAREWMTGAEPSTSTWGVVVVARKR